LISLVTLTLSYSQNLEELPEVLGNMTSLVTFNLNHCMNLKEVLYQLGFPWYQFWQSQESEKGQRNGNQ
jgi:hypothetical protein